MTPHRAAIAGATWATCGTSMLFLFVRHGGPLAISTTALALTACCVVIALISATIK